MTTCIYYDKGIPINIFTNNCEITELTLNCDVPQQMLNSHTFKFLAQKF